MAHNPDLTVIILAAGNGKRMLSSLPKVLQPLAGKPLIQHIIDSAQQLKPQQTIVVYGHQGHLVRESCRDQPLTWIEQERQLGTGHAVQQAMNAVRGEGRVLILYGDVPLITPATLKQLCAQTPVNGIGVLSADVVNPQGLGRIIRNDQGVLERIVEEKDATEEERQISEINTGIMVAPVSLLRDWLPKLSNGNSQSEYYLTDLIAVAMVAQIPLTTVTVQTNLEAMGVNTKLQLIELERELQIQRAHDLIAQGCHIIDPQRFDCRGELRCGKDVVIDVNVVLSGSNQFGSQVRVGPHCVLKNVILEEGVTVEAHSVIEDSTIKAHSTIGPFARIRPQSTIGPAARIGNFVEIKKSTIGKDSKVGHLSYIGDTVMGDGVNIGAGCITVNYDGARKYQTTIKDHVFIGCDSQLIAPVTLETGAFIGAGTTVTKNVPAQTLTLSRVPQTTIDSWQRPDERKES